MANAKQMMPKPVDPVTYLGVTYAAPHFVDGEAQNGGFIEARGTNGTLLWRLRIYDTNYDNAVEPDVQDVFVADLRIEDGTLIVTDEIKRVFEVDLKTRCVKEIEPNQSPY